MRRPWVIVLSVATVGTLVAGGIVWRLGTQDAKDSLELAGAPTPLPSTSTPTPATPEPTEAPSPTFAPPTAAPTQPTAAPSVPSPTAPPATAAPTAAASGSPSSSAPPASSATRRTSAEAQIFSWINQQRSANGQAPLTRSSCADGVSEKWAERMMTSGKLSHNPSYPSQLQGSCGPISGWAENIGFDFSVGAITSSWWNSPSHRSNILGPYTHVGVGVHQGSDGTLWATTDFYRR